MRRLPRYSVALLIGSAALSVLATTSCSSDGESDSTAGTGAQQVHGGNTSGGSPANTAGSAGSGQTPSTAGTVGMAGSGGSPGSAGASPTGGTGGAVGTGTAGRSGGSSGVAGAMGEGGSGTAGKGGSSGGGNATAGSAGASGGSGGGEGNELLAKFSFFVTSMKAIQILADNEKGFGGDLRFGKADGLSGADEICRQAAELGMPGAGNKQWRAFLSVAGPPVVNARDRIGKGPWYDARGRLVAQNLTDLLGAARPVGDAEVVNDLPNERGEPNHYVGENGYTPGQTVDNHDTLTGSDQSGNLYNANATCNDWTSSASAGRPRLGHSWPRNRTTGMGAGWASDHDAPGCTPGINITTQMGQGTCVGCSGGYGGIYCFELKE